MSTTAARKAILSIIKARHDEMMVKVKAELDQMAALPSVNAETGEDETLLDNFFAIADRNKGRRGKENRVNSWTAFAMGLTSAEPNGKFEVPRRRWSRPAFIDVNDLPAI